MLKPPSRRVLGGVVVVVIFTPACWEKGQGSQLTLQKSSEMSLSGHKTSTWAADAVGIWSQRSCCYSGRTQGKWPILSFSNLTAVLCGPLVTTAQR